MCEPACIKYTGGSTFTCSDLATAKAAAKRTYDAAVELFAYLCKKYNLNPTADGVIISHKEGCARGVATNHGDPEHLWKGLGLSYTMDGFRKAVKAAMTEKTEQPKPSTAATSTGSTIYYVQIGAYTKKANADDQAKKVKVKGFDAFVTTKGGTVAGTGSASDASQSLKVGDKVK